MFVINSNLAIVDEVTDVRRDKTEGYIKLGNPNSDETYGIITYLIRNRRLYIQEVVIDPRFREYKNVMLKHLKRQKQGIDWGVMTVPGNMVKNHPGKWEPVMTSLTKKKSRKRKKS
jgi:hypothetical protein